MKERPILFSTEMVRAILDGRKTQTRRTKGLDDVNNYPGRLSGCGGFSTLGYKGLMKSDYYLKPKKEFEKNPGLFHWFVGEQDNPNEINLIPVKCPYGAIDDRLWVRETFADSEPVVYRATLPQAMKDSDCLWKPSIFMPREFSRITLEIINIRAERLQDINESDAVAEGVQVFTHKAVAEYQYLWNKINGKDAWNKNPFVWVIEFRKVTA